MNAGRSANYSSSLYWIGYIQGAFQGPKSKDEDPDTEGGTLGINASPNKGALIFHETIRDKDPSLGSRVTGHELGHQFGLGEADDG